VIDRTTLPSSFAVLRASSSRVLLVLSPGTISEQWMTMRQCQVNQGHTHTTFRVRLYDLTPRTTYYYTVTSEESNGTSDGVKSTVRTFTTPAPGEIIVGARP